MTKKDIFDYFYTNSANYGARTIVLTMIAGLAISAIIFFIYWLTYRGVSYNHKFNISLVLVNLISVVIMLMISSNIVISLGMVGALSIVRFRTAIKDSRDTVFIFWSITEGLCVGSQNMELALITTLIIALIVVVSNFLPAFGRKYLLVVSGTPDEMDINGLIGVLNKYASSFTIRTVNKTEMQQDIIYEIKAKGELSQDIVNDLNHIGGIKTANWISESGESIG